MDHNLAISKANIIATTPNVVVYLLAGIVLVRVGAMSAVTASVANAAVVQSIAVFGCCGD